MFMQYDCYMLSAYSNSPSYFFFLVQCWNAILSDSCFYSTKKASHIVGKRLNKMKFIQGLNASNRHFPDPFFYLLLICLQRFYYTDVSPKTQPCKKLWLEFSSLWDIGGLLKNPWINSITDQGIFVVIICAMSGLLLDFTCPEKSNMFLFSVELWPLQLGSEAGDSSNSIRNRMSLREVRRSGSSWFWVVYEVMLINILPCMADGMEAVLQEKGKHNISNIIIRSSCIIHTYIYIYVYIRIIISRGWWFEILLSSPI